MTRLLVFAVITFSWLVVRTPADDWPCIKWQTRVEAPTGSNGIIVGNHLGKE